jgi:hypothetical protein
MDENSSGSSSKKRGLVATAAIIALLAAVVAIGLADYYIGTTTHQQTVTSVSTLTQPFLTTVVKTQTKTSTFISSSATTEYSVSTATAVSTSVVQETPTTTVSIVQTEGNISEITVSEAVLYSGESATSSSAATASLLIGFYNPNSTTYMTSMVLESADFLAPVIVWDNSSAASTASNQVSFSSIHIGNTISRGLTSVFTLYPESPSSVTLVSGETYQYVVFFANGSYVEGSLVAQ